MCESQVLRIDEIRQLIKYDPDSGILYWLERPVFRAHDKQWNARYAGTVALATPTTKGYLQGVISKRKYLAHRVAWGLFYGRWPEFQIDHINHQKSDNRIVNLRDCTASENMKNRPDYVARRHGILTTHRHAGRLDGNTWQPIGDVAARLIGGAK